MGKGRRVLRRMSFTTRSAGALEFAHFDLVFVPYSHYDETKTLLYPITSICLMNADGGQRGGRVQPRTDSRRWVTFPASFLAKTLPTRI